MGVVSIRDGILWWLQLGARGLQQQQQQPFTYTDSKLNIPKVKISESRSQYNAIDNGYVLISNEIHEAFRYAICRSFASIFYNVFFFLLFIFFCALDSFIHLYVNGALFPLEFHTFSSLSLCSCSTKLKYMHTTKLGGGRGRSII